jgi:hypothetical protein
MINQVGQAPPWFRLSSVPDCMTTDTHYIDIGFQMSDKVQRYIGMFIWLSVVFFLWFIDVDDLLQRFRFDVSPALSIVTKIFRHYVFYDLVERSSLKLFAGVAWAGLLGLALFYSWKLRGRPVKWVIKFGNWVHKKI